MQSEISQDQLYKICANVIYKEINNEVFILSSENSTVHTLNPTASEIWKLLQHSTQSVDSASKVLSNRYTAHLTQIKKDVRQIFAHLSKNNFIKPISN